MPIEDHKDGRQMANRASGGHQTEVQSAGDVKLWDDLRSTGRVQIQKASFKLRLGVSIG